MIKIYTDAAVKGNPGDVGIGILVLWGGKQIPLKFPIQTPMDNHQAELMGVKLAYEWLKEQKVFEEFIFLHTDSKSTVDAIQKNYTKRIENQDLLHQIQSLKEDFPQCFVKWIPESENRGADQLARQALQQCLFLKGKGEF